MKSNGNILKSAHETVFSVFPSFFYPDYTVGTGFAPVHASNRETRVREIDYDSHAYPVISSWTSHIASPPIGNWSYDLTLPRRNFSIVSTRVHHSGIYASTQDKPALLRSTYYWHGSGVCRILT